MNRLIAAAALVVATLSTAQAADDTINIKGVYIGMPAAEAKAIDLTTIAGIRNKYAPVANPLKGEHSVTGVIFFFDSSDFPTMLAAVRTKYPAIKCEESAVGNAMGAKFTQVECELKSGDVLLTLNRYVSDIKTSVLALDSQSALDARAAADAAKKAADL